MKSLISLLLIVFIAVAIFFLTRSGPAQPTNADDAIPTASSNAAPAEAVVNLTLSQSTAISIEPVQNYQFRIEKEAVGSVSLDEDPAIIQAESTLLGAAATYKLNDQELARATSLGVSNGISPKEMEQATSDSQTSAAALKAAREALRAVGKSDAEIDQMIATGHIDSKSDQGEWVVANVIETDSPSLRTGQSVKVHVLAFPDKTFAGHVSRIYGAVDPNSHRQEVRCEVDDPDKELHPGMFADVVIEVQDPVESPAIPANGVVREGDGTMTAWVTLDNHHFAQRIIKTGLREDGHVQILDGLKQGEFVVTDGAIYLDNILSAPPSD